MNLKKCISVMLASTAMSAAISGAASAKPGNSDLAFGKQLVINSVTRKFFSGDTQDDDLQGDLTRILFPQGVAHGTGRGNVGNVQHIPTGNQPQ